MCDDRDPKQDCGASWEYVINVHPNFTPQGKPKHLRKPPTIYYKDKDAITNKLVMSGKEQVCQCIHEEEVTSMPSSSVHDDDTKKEDTLPPVVDSSKEQARDLRRAIRRMEKLVREAEVEFDELERNMRNPPNIEQEKENLMENIINMRRLITLSRINLYNMESNQPVTKLNESECDSLNSGLFHVHEKLHRGPGCFDVNQVMTMSSKPSVSLISSESVSCDDELRQSVSTWTVPDDNELLSEKDAKTIEEARLIQHHMESNDLEICECTCVDAEGNRTEATASKYEIVMDERYGYTPGELRALFGDRGQTSLIHDDKHDNTCQCTCV
jgi:hypothetical protein